MTRPYTPEFRRELVERVERERPSPQELRFLLRQARVPKSTFTVWWKRWLKYGAIEDRVSGRPPAGYRLIVQQELERALEKWFGTPENRPKSARKPPENSHKAPRLESP